MGMLDETIDAFRRASSGDPNADVFEVNGITVACSQCGNTHFERDERMLNSRGMTFLDLDFANRNAAIYICKQCGHIEWFMK